MGLRNGGLVGLRNFDTNFAAPKGGKEPLPLSASDWHLSGVSDERPPVTVSSWGCECDELRLSLRRKAEQFSLRNSDRKLGYETRCGFLAGLEFRNPPEFRILRKSSFRKRETNLFF